MRHFKLLPFIILGILISAPAHAINQLDDQLYEEMLRPYNGFHKEYNQSRQQRNKEQEKENILLRKTRKNLLTEYSTLEERIQFLTKENTRMREENIELQQTNQILRLESIELEDIFAQRKQENNELTAQIEIREQENQKQRERNQEVLEKQMDLQSLYSQLQRETADLEALSAGQIEENQKLNGQIAKQKEDILALNNEKNDQMSTKAKLLGELEANRFEVTALTSSREELGKEIANLKTGILEQENMLRQNKDRQSSLQDSYANLKKESEELKNQIARQEDEHNKLKAKLDREHAEFNKRLLEFLRKEGALLEKRMMEYKDRKDEIETKIKSLE